MARPIGSRPSWDAAAGDHEWEICNDDGFVYRRRRHTDDPLRSSPPSSSRKRDADGRRARKKKTLLSLKAKYQNELNQWDHLSTSLAQITSAAVVPTEPPPGAPPPLVTSSSAEIEELLLQVKAQESILGRMNELCDYVEALCEAEEERMGKALMELPVWGSPRCLVASLMSM